MKVFLKFRERKVVLSFDVPEGGSELDTLRDVFNNFVKRDAYLSNKMKDHFPIFEYHNSEFDEDVEISNSEEPLPSTTLTVKFCPVSSPQKQQLLAISEVDCRPNVPCNLDNGDISMPATSDQIVLIPQAEQVEVLKPSKKKRKANDKYSIDRFPMPQLSQHVQDIFMQGQGWLNTGPFIQQAADHLEKIVPRPTPTMYKNYSKALLLNFPQLAEAQADPAVETYTMLTKMISNYIRNSRKRRKRDESEPAKAKRGSMASRLLNQPQNRKRKLAESSTTAVIDEEEGYMSLLKRSKFDSEELCKLLPKFTTERRNALAEFDSISNLLTHWPAFSHPVVIETEFSICANVSPEVLKENFTMAVQNLGELFQCDTLTEASKIRMLNQVEKSLQVNVSNKYPSAIGFQELSPEASTVLMPDVIFANAPISMSYLRNNGTICKTYFYAESKIILVLENMTAFDVYKTLIGMYYAYARHYPKVSKNMLDFLDFCVLKQDVKSSSTKVRGLKRRYTSLSNTE